jgi:hypothetical protein
MSTDYTLAHGPHGNPDDGRCAMEWVSHLAGEPHNDQPACVSLVLRAFCTALNDSLEDEPRQHLRPYLARTIGTGDDGLDEARSWMAMDWLIRTYTPTWLSVARLLSPAQCLSDLPPVLSSADLPIALDALNAARAQSRAAWASALGPMRAATLTPWAAGRAAAREAAWASAGAAAWGAARVAVGDIAGDRARALAREIGGDAAATIARGARAGASRAAARDSARAALAPTIAELHASAFSLLDRMLPTSPLALSSAGPDAAESGGPDAATRASALQLSG